MAFPHQQFTEMSGQSHEANRVRYPSINIHGNSPVVIGNVYGLDSLTVSDERRRRRKILLLQDLQLDPRSAGARLVVVSSELLVLLLRDFEHLKTSLCTFGKLESRLETYAKRVNVRRSIFQHALLTLLSGYVGHEQAQIMLADEDHPAWLYESFTRYLHARFGARIEAVRDVLELISTDLDAITGFLQKCQKFRDDSPAGTLNSLKQMKLKFKAAFNCVLHEDNITEHYDSLKQNTDDFISLLHQYTPQKTQRYAAQPSEQTKLSVNRYRRVHEAAIDLHRAFRLACAEHDNHQGHLRLLAESNTPSHVQLTILLDCAMIVAHSLHEISGVRLTIESQVTSAVVNASNPTSGILHSLTNRKRNEPDADVIEHASDWVCPKRKASKVKEVGGSTDHPRLTLPDAGTSTDSFPNFCDRRNFCTRLQDTLSRECQNDMPLGYLSPYGSSKHLIYLTRHVQSANTNLSPRDRITSFRAFYSAAGCHISTAEIISIAKQLALAVLQYQATPWLQEKWNSDNIFIERNHTVAGTTSTSPHNTEFDAYLSFSISNPTQYNHSSTSFDSRTCIKNWTLFGFALMLLELAYKAPIRQMQTQQDIEPTESICNTDYRTAIRIQQTLASKVGTVYSDIVNKCLRCKFDHGHDLGRLKLQEEFYENVIVKLENLEAQFAAIGL